MKRFDLKSAAPLLSRVKRSSLILFVCSAALAAQAAASNSVARVWDERALAAIRADTPHPPAQEVAAAALHTRWLVERRRSRL